MPTIYKVVINVKEVTRAYKILAGRPEGKEPLGRPRHRWYGHNKWILKNRF
jgi:hypothetical protein